MTSPPGLAPVSLARPAVKGADTELDPALVRRTTTALAAVSGLRRKDARALVVAYATGARPAELDGWSHWLRNELGVCDPTGESVARSLDRERGR